MPRDANGNYTLPAGNPVVAGTTIDSVWCNTTMDDIANAITDSLDREGRGGMLVPFENADGNVAAPGVTWSNEPSSGFYRNSLGDMRVSVLSLNHMRWNAGVTSVFVAGVWQPVLYTGGPQSAPPGNATGQMLRWNNVTGRYESTGALVVSNAGNTTATGSFGADSLTAVGNVVAGGNLNGANSTVINNSTAGFFIGDGSQLTSLPVAPAVWGGITGTLANQLDLSTALSTASGLATWGGVGGTLSNQLDLQAALNLKTNLTVFDAHATDVDIHYADAPTDGQLYARANLSWSPTSSLSYTGYTSDATSDGQANEAAGWNDYAGRNVITRTANEIIYWRWTGASNDVFQYIGNQLGPVWSTSLGDWILLSGVATSWGTITGTLADQLDLQAALDAKANEADLLSHTNNAAIHFTEGSISHLNIQNIGANTHASIDQHIADASIHYVQSAISHLNLQNVGGNTHSQIDSHIADVNIHYAQTAINHSVILNLSSDDHPQYLTNTRGDARYPSLISYNSHVDNASIHFPDAPSDGQTYGRTVNTWAPLSGLETVGFVSSIAADAEPTVSQGWNLYANNLALVRNANQVYYFNWPSTTDDLYQFAGNQVGPVWTTTDSVWLVSGGAVVAWGGITGTLSNQTDLQDALNLKTDLTVFDAHATDAAIHFTEASIDHTQIQNVGTNTHVGIDAHIADINIHFPDAPNNGNIYVRQSAAWAIQTTVWGNITGTLSNQTDLQNALNAASATAWGPISGTLANQVDLQNALNAKISSVVEDTTPVLGGLLDLNGKALGSLQTATAGNSFAVGSVGIRIGAGTISLADATQASTADGELFMAVTAIAGGVQGAFVEYGVVNGLVGLVSGDTYYLEIGGGGGNITNVAPVGSGNQVRVVGYARSTTLFSFKPDITWLEIT